MPTRAFSIQRATRLGDTTLRTVPRVGPAVTVAVPSSDANGPDSDHPAWAITVVATVQYPGTSQHHDTARCRRALPLSGRELPLAVPEPEPEAAVTVAVPFPPWPSKPGPGATGRWRCRHCVAVGATCSSGKIQRLATGRASKAAPWGLSFNLKFHLTRTRCPGLGKRPIINY